MNYSDNDEIIICEGCDVEFAVAQFGNFEEEVHYCPFCSHDLLSEDEEEYDEDEDEDDKY